MPEKLQVYFKWQGKNYRLDIPLENIEKIEVQTKPAPVSGGSKNADGMKLEEDSTEFFVHLRKPANVYGE